MNEDMKISERGLKLIAAFEGKPRLKARRCEGGKWELSYGCTTWPPRPGETKARPVKEGDTCTEAEALEMFDYHLDEAEAIVRRHVPNVKLNQHQFDALVSKVYNIGETQFATGADGPSTILRMINDPNGPRWEEAAEGFTLWTAATKDADERDPDEPIEWYLSPDKQPCAYRRRFSGLLRRCLAEAVTFLGHPWEQACGPNAGIELLTRREWNAKRRRNEDVTVSKTELSAVLRIARTHTMPADVVVPKPEPVKAAPPAPITPAPAATAPPATPQAPKPQAPPPVPAPLPKVDVANADIGKIRVENGAKVMETSDRAVAVGLKLGGIALKTCAERRIVPAVVTTLYFDAVSDPMIVAAICVGVAALWAWGQGMLVAGRRKRAKHALTASTLTY